DPQPRPGHPARLRAQPEGPADLRRPPEAGRQGRPRGVLAVRVALSAVRSAEGDLRGDAGAVAGRAVDVEATVERFDAGREPLQARAGVGVRFADAVVG